MSAASLSEQPADRQIASTRLVAHPSELVYEALSNSSILARWWGPEGFTDTIEAFDFTEGGVWLHTLHAPDGMEYPNRAVFTAIVPLRRVTFDHNSGKQFEITLEPQGVRTAVTLRILCESAAACDAIRGIVAPANEQNLDRLEAALAEIA
ncbi:MAG TPA: SRPBCC domain-containing protein [Devosiaceae bacterium]|jgi:uncharacterized protein YndB with AHSA1/START domain